MFWKPEHRDYSVAKDRNYYSAFLTRHPSMRPHSLKGKDIVATGCSYKDALEIVRLIEDASGIVAECLELQPIDRGGFILIASVWFTPYRNDPKAYVNKPVFVQFGWRREVMRICMAQRLWGFHDKTVYGFIVTPYANRKWKQHKYKPNLAACMAALFNSMQGWKRTAKDRAVSTNNNLQRARDAEARTSLALAQIAETVSIKRRRKTKA